MGKFRATYERVTPLDITEVCQPGDTIHRKAALRHYYGGDHLCIAGTCCNAQVYGSVFCIAHRKGLGLDLDTLRDSRKHLEYAD